MNKLFKTYYGPAILLLTLSIIISGCVTPSIIDPIITPVTPTITIQPSTATPFPPTVTAVGSPIPSLITTITANPTSTNTPTSTPIVTPTITPTVTPFPSNAPSDSGSLSVHFISVGQGDSILIKTGDKAMLIDGGPQDAGSTVASYLRSQGVNTIDVLVSTHPHADHIGGLLTILNQFPVRQIVDSGQVTSSQTYESYLTLIDQKNIPYQVGERGQTINLGSGVSVEILSPPSSKFSDLNQNSIVLKITHGGGEFPPNGRRWDRC